MTSQTQKNKLAKVFVGISGGVDSAVSAALLKKDGYDITGVYIKVWQPDWIECNWKEERRDAMRVAAHLGIPFVTLDLEKEYKNAVIDYMISEYMAGRTPNPDVMCNREVKFGAFWRWAKKQGADFVATGHYAQVKKNGDRFSLEAGRDKNKDQSYFLWTLNQADLEHVLFPIGHLEKPEVRKLATKFGLPNATKKDSQGLCFIGKVDIKEFLRHYISNNMMSYDSPAYRLSGGDVLNKKGDKVGIHPGALFFTIGERHGFTITKKTTTDSPFYVVSKDMKLNTITVDVREQKDNSTSLAKVSLVEIHNTNWTNKIPKVNDEVKVRTRYRQSLASATIVAINNKEALATIKIEQTTDPITPGQSLVIYNGEECLGGGVI